MYKLTSPPVIKEILSAHGFTFTKSLGQNFLIDQNIVNNIVAGASIKGENVLEIGPGIGALSQALAKDAKKLVAIEIDKSLESVLKDTLGHLDNVDLIFEDVLKVDIKKVQKNYFNDEKFKVVANLPYYITTPIISHLLTSGADVDELIIMMQKEVADRIVAPVGTREYGSISAFIKYFGDSQILFKIPPTVFMPRPGVDSAVLKIKINHKRSIEELKKIERILAAAFNQRRKTITNSISSGLGITKDQLREVLVELDIDPRLRAEDLSIEDYINIQRRL